MCATGNELSDAGRQFRRLGSDLVIEFFAFPWRIGENDVDIADIIQFPRTALTHRNNSDPGTKTVTLFDLGDLIRGLKDRGCQISKNPRDLFHDLFWAGMLQILHHQTGH